MTPSERQILEKIDNLVLTASVDELRKIQEIDIQTQMCGLSFYDALVNSSSLTNQSSNHSGSKTVKRQP